MITAGNIKVYSSFSIANLSDMRIEIKKGGHKRLVLRGGLFGGLRGGNPEAEDIRVAGMDENGREITLFHGIIQENHIFHENGVNQIILTAMSRSAKMDKERHSRSFQNTAMPCVKIINDILSEYGGQAICEDNPINIGKPVVQYEETDWEFCKRMAGRMGLGIFSGSAGTAPVLKLGLVTEGRAEFSEDEYRCCVDGEYYKHKGEGRAERAEFLYYQVESEQNYEIGDSTWYQGQKRYIFEKMAELKGDRLVFSYKLGGKCRFMEREDPNRKIAGVSLQGRVEKTDRETVYIKLDIDGKNGSAAYPYPWAPITAGLMYSMPQPGTKVYLYFPDCHEGNAIVVDAIHTGEPNDGFGDVQNRGYVTEHGKMLLLYRDSLCIRAGRQKREQKFSLGGKEISLCTGKGKMTIVGQGDITFCAPEIRVTTPQKIAQLKSAVYAAQRGSIYPKGSRNPPTGGDAAFSMQYEFNGFAEQGILIGTQYEKYKPFEDDPYVQDCPTWMKVVAGILVAALVGLAVGALVFATGGAAAFILGVTTAQLAVGAGVLTAGAGMLAAGATYAHDKKNGTESSLEEYVQNALNASAEVGGACVKLCIAVYGAHAATLLETGGTRVGIDVLRQVLRAKMRWAGWNAIINIGFQVDDVMKFAFQGKELGAPTKNIGYDFSKNLTESVTDQYVLLGMLNPYLYVNAFRSISSLFGGATEAGTELILQGTTSGTGLMLQETAVETSYALQGVAAGELALPAAGGSAYTAGTALSTVFALESATQKTLLLPDKGGGLKTVDTGKLKVIEIKTPEIANSEWLARGYDKPPYDLDYEVKVVEAGNEEYVRVFSYNEDGTSNKLGGWLMRKSDIEGLTPAQIADKYALPKEPTHICDVKVNPDFILQTGIANEVKGWGSGGGQQFDTMGKFIDEDAFVNERLIGE